LPTNKRPYRVTLGDAVAAHEGAIAKFGGRAGIHDLGLLEAALAPPYCGYFRTVAAKAATLLHGLATSHGFVDGNKRTALLMFYLFMENSGFEFTPTSTLDEDDIEHLIIDLTTHFISHEEAIRWIGARIRRKSDLP
jgi:death-on-curing protein